MRRKWRERARFGLNAPAPSRLPASVSVVPRSLTGEEVVEDAFFKSVTITPRSADTHGLTLMSQGSSATGDELRALNFAGTVLLEIDNSAHVNFGDYYAMASVSPPGTPNAGVIRVFANNKELFYINEDGTIRTLSNIASAVRGLASMTAPVTVSALTTRSTAVTTTIAANTATAGQTYRARVFGRATCPSDATPSSFPIEFRVATVAITTLSLSVPSLTAVTDANWEAEFYFTIRTIGAGGTCIAHGRGSDRLDLTSLTNSLVHAGTATTTAIDTTASKAIDVAISCGEATAGYAITAEVGSIELIKP